jgi:4a-hydroxytetrahydrobiopterin dehydratase
MPTPTADQLIAKKCKDREAGEPKYTRAQAEEQLKALTGWTLTHDGLRIRKDWTVKDFAAGLEFFRSVGDVAEAENHHPDLHLENYRNVWIENSTHVIGGLSENDFILAAKIDRLPVTLKQNA